MHTSYTVGITTSEYLALNYVTSDPQEWIENFIQNRARIATDDIIIKYTTYKINKGEPITAVGSTEVIQAAIDEGVISIVSS